MRRFAFALPALLLALALGCAGAPPADGGGGDVPIPTGTLAPGDLVYLGAFRLPGASGGSSWEWSGDGLTYCPTGDAAAAPDGFPGSLFGIGHDHHKQVSEVTIPAPMLSRNPGDLPVASTLRPFTDVRAGVGQLDLLQEVVRSDIEYLPAQTGQDAGHVYLCWGAHYQEEAENVASHMWCDLDLTGSIGAWWVGDYSPYSVNDYLFEIPANWADRYVGGRRLGTGRYRDGGWGGQGPNLYAIAPWQHGNPPPPNARLAATELLHYSPTGGDVPPTTAMTGYHHADEWTGAAWLTAGDRAAVVFVGTKGVGECWYGLPDGTVWPDGPPYPADPENQRGWWSTGFEASILFYDPADLARVAEGAVPPYQPQPYAQLPIDARLLNSGGSQRKYRTGAIAFDRVRGLLYLLEPRADEDRSVVHVWRVGA